MKSDEIKAKLLYHFRYKKSYHMVSTETGPYHADFLGSSGKEIIECEVKVSLADLKQDYLKRKHKVYQNIKSYNRWCPNRFYFAVPKYLEADALKITEDTPYGVLVVDSHPLSVDFGNEHKYIRTVRKAKLLQKKLSGCLEHTILLRMSSHYTKLLTTGLTSDLRDTLKVCGIYKIHNKDTDKFYIGKSTNIFKRWETHKYNLSRGVHHNKNLQEDFVNGHDDLEYSVLEYSISKEHLTCDEFKWVDYYNTLGSRGYNIMPVKKGTPIEDREKIFVKSRSGKNNSNYKHVPEKTKKLICDIYKQGDVTVAEIVTLTGFTGTVIVRCLDECNVTTRTPSGQITYFLDVDALRNVFRQDKTITDITSGYMSLTGKKTIKCIIGRQVKDLYPDYKADIDTREEDNPTCNDFDVALATESVFLCVSIKDAMKKYNEYAKVKIESHVTFKDKAEHAGIELKMFRPEEQSNLRHLDYVLVDTLVSEFGKCNVSLLVKKYNETNGIKTSAFKIKQYLHDRKELLVGSCVLEKGTDFL